MWLAQNPPASFLAAVRVGLLLDEAGDLFCETQGPNLFTQKTLTARTHPPALGQDSIRAGSGLGLCLPHV